MADIFQRLAARGQTIVVVTHDQALAQRAGRMVVTEDGVILTDDPITEEMRSTKHEIRKSQ